MHTYMHVHSYLRHIAEGAVSSAVPRSLADVPVLSSRRSLRYCAVLRLQSPYLPAFLFQRGTACYSYQLIFSVSALFSILRPPDRTITVLSHQCLSSLHLFKISITCFGNMKWRAITNAHQNTRNCHYIRYRTLCAWNILLIWTRF